MDFDMENEEGRNGNRCLIFITIYSIMRKQILRKSWPYANKWKGVQEEEILKGMYYKKDEPGEFYSNKR